MPKIVVIADPETLPVELADNPDVVIVPPGTVSEEVMAALDEASGGLLGAGEGPLEDWAKEEEAEPEHSGSGDDEEDKPSGEGDEQRIDDAADVSARGDDDLPMGGGADDDEDEPRGGSGRGVRGGRGRGRGDDEEPAERPSGSGRGKSPLAAWVASQTGRR